MFITWRFTESTGQWVQPPRNFFFPVAGIGEICFVYSVLIGAVKSSVKCLVMSAKMKNIILKHLLKNLQHRQLYIYWSKILYNAWKFQGWNRSHRRFKADQLAFIYHLLCPVFLSTSRWKGLSGKWHKTNLQKHCSCQMIPKPVVQLAHHLPPPLQTFKLSPRLQTEDIKN